MNKNIKSFLQEIHEKDVQELAEDHVRDVIFDEVKKEVTVLIDKRYAMNLLQSAHYISHFIGALRKCFGEKTHVVLRLDHPHHAHEREMLIPLFVHY
ncbi:MAG: hypothetical protein PHN60_03075 [Candidatus Gracilibacteria bacterium]|nr:hypothetical protein [Candidatus Gracilibacteria bacterium]